MALPKLDLPTFNLVIPSTEQKVTYRPFLVKEEKILMMANEGEDSQEITVALKQIINNCCLDEINVDDLATFDVEYFFLMLRAKSMSNTLRLVHVCDKMVSKKKCGTTIEFEVDLDKIKVEKSEGHDKKIELTDTVGIMMKYPSLEKTLGETTGDADSSLELIESCMDYIYDTNNTYKMKDAEPGETIEFLEGLTKPQFDKIQTFFNTMPRIKYSSKVVCDKCEGKHNVEIEGMQSFFV